MNIGLVVEGPSDKAAYPVLIRKIREGAQISQVRDCGGRTKLKNSFPGLLKEFARNPAWNIARVFVIQDSDCRPHQIIEERLRNRLLESDFEPEFQVRFFATKCALESWLLADTNAIATVSQRRGKNKQVDPVNVNLDSFVEVKKLFWDQLSKADLRAVPPVYAEIASAVDIEQVSGRCPSFRRFIEQVRA